MAYLILVLLALCVGSFANVCIHRLPRGESLRLPPSHCPSCKTPIRWFDNIPVLSYIALNGRCRSCHQKFGLKYVLVELLCALFWAAVAFHAHFDSWIMISGLILTTALLVAAATDLEGRLIPNEITLFLIVMGGIFSPWNPLLAGGAPWRAAQSLLGIVWGGGLLWATGLIGQRIWKKEAMGGGDVKLAAGLGAFLGWKGAATAIVLASVCGALWGLAQMTRGKLRRGDYIPFGPFLALGGTMAWFMATP